MLREETLKRIAGMKERMITNCPTELLPERALLVTEAYKLYASEPPVLKRAYALRHILENMTLFIDEGELFVGHNSPKPRSPIACPELGARWILADLDNFATRPADASASRAGRTLRSTPLPPLSCRRRRRTRWPRR